MWHCWLWFCAVKVQYQFSSVDYKELNESEEMSLPFQKGNGGKDNPVLSVVP